MIILYSRNLICLPYIQNRDERAGDVKFEMEKTASDLKHNAIMQEFDAMYDREQRIIYGD